MIYLLGVPSSVLSVEREGACMSVTATLELRLKAEDLEQSYAIVHETLAATRAFDGNLGVDVLIDNTDPTHLLVVESWRSIEDDNAYRAWRATDAGKSDLGSVLAGAPVLTIFTKSADL
jgi:heme oxygenase (mycobilin-producing)